MKQENISDTIIEENLEGVKGGDYFKKNQKSLS